MADSGRKTRLMAAKALAPKRMRNRHFHAADQGTHEYPGFEARCHGAV